MAQATLTSADGKYKVVVNVGSSQASQLQSKGWKLGATGKTTVNLNTALQSVGASPVSAAASPPITPAKTTTPNSGGTPSPQLTALSKGEAAGTITQQSQVQTTPTPSGTNTTQPAQPVAPVAPQPSEIANQLKTLGLSDDTIKAMTPDQQSLFASIGTVLSKQYEQSNPVPQTLTASDLDALMTQAQSDPTIGDYYKEQLRIGQAQFTQAVALKQQDYATLQAQQQRDYAESQKQQNEQYAGQGAEYSGFREQAKQKLAADESGIIESSQSQAQQDVNTLAGGYESKFGTTALNSAGLPTFYGKTYTPLGNIQGTQAQAQQLDIAQKDQDLINKTLLTRGLQ